MYGSSVVVIRSGVGYYSQLLFGEADGIMMDTDVVAAIGTFFAVFVALILARRTEQLAVKADKQKSDLVAARTLEIVRAMEDQLHGCMGGFAFYNDQSQREDAKFANEVLSLADHSSAIGLDTLHALAPLPRNCANRLAMGLGVVDVLVREVRDATEANSWPLKTPEYRQGMASRWVSLSSRGLDYLRVALRELEKAADIVAPRPSPEEIHGE